MNFFAPRWKEEKNVNWDKDIKQSLDENLSGLYISKREQAQMFNRIIQGEKPIMKRKVSAALVFAIVLILAMGGMALAAGLGLFGHFSMEPDNNNGNRLNRLEDNASTYEMTKQVSAPTPQAEIVDDTLYDKLLQEAYGHTFTLTLDQAYCDGHKLYYSYTLTRNEPQSKTFGEGEPTGNFDWYWVEEGKKAADCMYLEGEEADWFNQHEIAYMVNRGFYLGDGARMLDGTDLMIYDSSDERIGEDTIRGFQEVEIPEEVELGDTIDFTLTVHDYTSICYQSERGFERSSVKTPENRGFTEVPFTVKVNTDAELHAGSITTDDYSAQATLFISDVDVYGQVSYDAPEWVKALEEYDRKIMNDEQAEMPQVITEYKLIADGKEMKPIDGGFGIDRQTGKYIVHLRYDVPESHEMLSLIPLRGADEAENPDEEIYLN